MPYKWLPVINRDACTGCRNCVEACEHCCLEMDVWEFATLERPFQCGGEGYCMKACPEEVIRMGWVELTGDQIIGQWCDQPDAPSEKPKSWWSQLWTAAIIAAIMIARSSADEPADTEVGDPYPLADCVILETQLNYKSKVIGDEGQQIRVCCEECVEKYFEQRLRWNEKIEKQLIAQQMQHYPLKKCVVDDAPLLEFAPGFGTINHVCRNRLFRLCSGKCRDLVDKSPGKYFEKLDRAVTAKQKPTYSLAKCSGKPLGHDSVDYVVANQLIRLADKSLIDTFNKSPGRYLVELNKARAAALNAKPER